MKISIKNFKSIAILKDFEFRPLSIVCGVNSSGKSSLVQFLLALKQTVELESNRSAFEVVGPYFHSDVNDLLHRQENENNIQFILKFNNSEIPNAKRFAEYDLLQLGDPAGEWTILVNLNLVKSRLRVSNFQLSYGIAPNVNNTSAFKRGKPGEWLAVDKNNDSTWSIESSNASFDPNYWIEQTHENVLDVIFSSIFPSLYLAQDGDLESTTVLNIRPAKAAIEQFLSRIVYLGPTRRKPQEYFDEISNVESVGTDGQYTAQVLYERGEDPLTYYRILNSASGFRWRKSKGTLLQAVNYWMCDVFGIGRKISSVYRNETYRIFITTADGLQVGIRHVGFGVSQILPVIVSGLMLPAEGILVTEEPESHLHPKLQSDVFDFFFSLIKGGKRVLVETHSDHFLMRMRRRIAEDPTNELVNSINLSFVEQTRGISNFRQLDLDDFGSIDDYPRNFTEMSKTELTQLLRAQMGKRRRDALR